MEKRDCQFAGPAFLKIFLLFIINLEYVSSKDYCVIGAGPSGLQMGYFLERAGRDYIIYERGTSPGSFYKVYPRHRTLISLNKRYTGKKNKEFNLRHDWNSLISDNEDLLMTKYSKEFFPKADVMVKYLADYATKLSLKIQYNTAIVNVAKNNNETYVLTDKKENEYFCKYLIISTGLYVENIPKELKGVEHTVGYADMSINQEEYEGKTILILGKGNSGFETATHLLPSANLVHMFSRHRLRFSWETHYVGDVRAINCGPIDTYQLKSLDGQLEGDLEVFSFEKHNNKIYIREESERKNKSSGSPLTPEELLTRQGYDTVIRATGFKFDRSIFSKDVRPKISSVSPKYPEIKGNYEITSAPNMYLTGTATHSMDFRKSAGAFIHGFRYTTRTLHRYLEWKHHGVTWPHVTLSLNDLMNYFLQRLNQASDIYQMFSVLCDVIVFRDGDKFEYYQSLSTSMLSTFEEHTGMPFTRGVVINFEYGKNFSGPGKDPFKEDRATQDPQEAHTSNFLHPVLYYYEGKIPKFGTKTGFPRPARIHHMVEDFLIEWVKPLEHLLPLRWFFENITGRDLRKFYAETCFKYAMTGGTLPMWCQEENRHMLIQTSS